MKRSVPVSKNKRNIINKLNRSNEIRIKRLEDFSSIITFLENIKDKEQEFKIKRETEAIIRLLKLENKYKLLLLCLFHEDKIIGFIINEILSDNKHSIGHFLKSSTKFHSGFGTIMLNKMCQILHEKGFYYLNMEQDLGLPGLRKWKELHKPTHFLKKYAVIYR